MGERARWYGELAWIAKERGYQSGWIANTYKKFGVWPQNVRAAAMRMPSADVRNFVRSLQIRYAHRRSAA